MNQELETIWVQLNGALHDVQNGDLEGAEMAIQDCLVRLQLLGAGK